MASSNALADSAAELQPPEIPDHYFKFTGRIVEVHALDDSAGAAYRDIFARERFEAEFKVDGLPQLVGLDLEWKPDKCRPHMMCDSRPGNPVALIQLACWDSVLLIRTTGCDEMPPWLRNCLEDAHIVKVSASFDVADKAKLKSSFGWDFDKQVRDPASFVDVAEQAKEFRLPLGLKRLCENLKAPMLKLHEVGCSKWATEVELSNQQRPSAAEDAFFTLYVFGLILERARGQALGLGRAWGPPFETWCRTEEQMRKKA
jgi:hypothetical protein